MQDGGSRSTAKAVVYGSPPGWLTPLLLGIMIGIGAWILHEMGRIATEVRILQIHVQDQSAILIKRGLKTPDDDNTGPTSGTHP